MRSGVNADGSTLDTASAAGQSPLGVVHCFVESEELRRLLANMAATELVTMIMQAALGT